MGALAVFTEAIATGREIEFTADGRTYFLSRHSDTDWYLYCEETKEKQSFPSGKALLANAEIGGKTLTDRMDALEIITIY